MSKYDYLKTVFTGSEHCRLYEAYRPTLPEEVFEVVLAQCGGSKKTEKNRVKKTSDYTAPRQPPHYHPVSLALDIGCGPGNSTMPLTKYFNQVIGVDVSEEQISRAPQDVPGVSFHLCQAENMPFIQSGSVDLITLACALHWLDLDKFYPEVDRVLKPGGMVAAMVYIPDVQVDHPGVEKFLMKTITEDLADYWPPGILHLALTRFHLPAPYEPWIRNEEMVMHKEWTVEQISGFMQSLAPCQAYQRQHPEEDFALRTVERMTKLISDGDDTKVKDRVFRLTFPIVIMFSQKPGNAIQNGKM